MSDIHSLLIKASDKVGVIGKNSYNEGQKFAFRGIDQVIAAVHPVFNDLGILVYPRVIDHQSDERDVIRKNGDPGVERHVVIRVEYTFVAASDGSSVTAMTVGEAIDSADKAANKAMSAALKYALTQTLLTPTLDMLDDADGSSPQPTRSMKPGGFPPAKQSTSNPATDKQLNYLYKLVARNSDLADQAFTAAGVTRGDAMTTAQASKVIDLLNDLLKQGDE